MSLIRNCATELERMLKRFHVFSSWHLRDSIPLRYGREDWKRWLPQTTQHNIHFPHLPNLCSLWPINFCCRIISLLFIFFRWRPVLLQWSKVFHLWQGSTALRPRQKLCFSALGWLVVKAMFSRSPEWEIPSQGAADHWNTGYYMVQLERLGVLSEAHRNEDPA